MATADLGRANAAPQAGQKRQNGTELKRLHRINTVRLQQGVSLRSAARRLGTDMATVRTQTEETSDLRLSELYRWQEILDVPLVDLLVDPGTPLSRPVMERAQLVRMMKTALAIRECANTPQLERLIQTLLEQFVELMPELKDVTPWHSVGQRRSINELGRIAEHPIPEHYLGGHAGFCDD